MTKISSKKNKKAVKVICTFFGERRSTHNTPDNPIEFLKLMIENEKSMDNGVETDVIIVNNDCGNHESNNILISYNGHKTKNGEIKVEFRENLGGSFGGYYYTFLKYKDKYDYWFFCEDDVLIYKPKYMINFIDYIDSDENLGFVCLAPISYYGNRPHSGGGCGLTSTDKFLRSRPTYYMEEHFKVSLSKGNHYKYFEEYEIDFTNTFIRSGMSISNHPSYSPFCENNEKHLGQLSHFVEDKLEKIYKVGF